MDTRTCASYDSLVLLVMEFLWWRIGVEWDSRLQFWSSRRNRIATKYNATQRRRKK
jgi:hypothetical protein